MSPKRSPQKLKMSLHAMNYFAIATMQRGEFEHAAHLFLSILKNLKNDLNAEADENKATLNGGEVCEREPYYEEKPSRKRRKTDATPSPLRVSLFYTRLVQLDRNADEGNAIFEKADSATSSSHPQGLSVCQDAAAKTDRIPSISDTADLICSSAIATFATSADTTATSSVTTTSSTFVCREDEVLFNTSVLSGALLYNTGLCFHLQWFKTGQTTFLRKALNFYEAARNILQTAFSLATAPHAEKDAIAKNCETMELKGMANNVGMILLALVNNMSAIFQEHIQIDPVNQLRGEMRYIFQLIDPIVAFGADNEACTSLYMNAFFYGENQDMNAARAA